MTDAEKKRTGRKGWQALAVFACAALHVFLPAVAQEAAPPVAAMPADMPPQPQALAMPEPAVQATPAVSPAVDSAAAATDINPNEIGPLIFTYWERAALQDARKSRGLSRPPTQSELTAPGTEKIKPPPEEREISLDGIVYKSDSNWVVWLNGKRVTPRAIPKEVLNLKVHEKYIEMKWFDDYSNEIFPLRLHPHERFNIDTRIFIPG